MNCHAGCTFDDICQSLHIEKSDLFLSTGDTRTVKEPDRQKDARNKTGRKAKLNAEGKVEFYSNTHKKHVTEFARYIYQRADGSTARYVIRTEPKDFRPMTPEGELSLDGVERVPYRLPELIKGVKESKQILLLEGRRMLTRQLGWVS